MPRGRHRHSQPLHRILPPLTVAGCAIALAAASLFAGDTTALRVITGVTALCACAGAGLSRSWDRAAGRRVAELETLRERDEWRADERVAELETDLEESRELRGRLEKKLRSKRGELARLRTEHADLLRRYATAESERARALEARRRLQVKSGGSGPALTAGPSPIGPAAFLKAQQALQNLARNGAQQQAQATVEEARRRDVAAADEPQGKHAAAEDGNVPVTSPAGLPVREHKLVPAVAAAVLPYAQPRSGGVPAHRAIGGFDFFGTQKPGGAGEPEDEHAQASDEPAASEVIDLTAHDETEQLDMSELRAQA
ncbi:hypothetical protein OG552_14890 [Streptomyces sp. NBC_01476]|uniref:hypothetical protein n=1 Tax=Streptomyces sp. NBC_01476 TaxID=2903881 RepID=UPI002E32ACBA|nr:hypothetical protein [Streptomyces sp. NBC_01476]